MKRLTASVCLLLALVASGASAQSVRAEVMGRIEELLTAFRNGDARGVAQMFRDDASILGPNTRVIGRVAIDSY
jgi:ketosteroid isomerase-like protein